MAFDELSVFFFGGGGRNQQLERYTQSDGHAFEQSQSQFSQLRSQLIDRLTELGSVFLIWVDAIGRCDIVRLSYFVKTAHI